MLHSSNIPFSVSKALNPLVFDYIDKKKQVEEFYSFFPDEDGFKQLLKTELYAGFDRDKLIQILQSQSESVKNASASTQKNISLLKNKTTFTVTAGHQLCLFTGPLYFIYKLFSVINLSEELKKKFPDFDFVPVYWMATEDHDFEEVNHLNLFGKKISWETKQSGAVGRFNTEELKRSLELFKPIAGPSENAKTLIELFENSYLKHSTLKEATRYLVNELFGKYGLVIVDGDDKEFKKQAVKLFEKDIFENSSFAAVGHSINKLNELKYKNQVNPREINCFYLDENYRGRIEKENNKYKVGTKSLNENELKELISSSPEKISPNVVLRPVYQQSILPNIAYVGGPGELAYWLQYKRMFEGYKVQFPVLVPRSFITVVDKNLFSKIEKLGFGIQDFFEAEEELIKKFLLKNNPIFSLEEEKKKVAENFKGIREKIEKIDPTLVNLVSAEEQKTINSLDTISQKAIKALKQRSETQINQIHQIKEQLFPGGIAQERVENFSRFYLSLGDDFLTYLKQEIKVLALNHTLITEE